MKKLYKLVLAATGALLSTLIHSRDANAGTCNIAFSDSYGLSLLPASQAYGFAESPWYMNWCPNVSQYFNVSDNGGTYHDYNFHFWADDPTVNCVTSNSTWPIGVMGRQGSTGKCVAVNPLTTSREVNPHDPGYFIDIETLSAPVYGWRAAQIFIKGTVPGKVLVQNTDGTWWQYTNLTPGVWNLWPNGHKALRAYVMNQNATPETPVVFDNFVVEGPI